MIADRRRRSTAAVVVIAIVTLLFCTVAFLALQADLRVTPGASLSAVIDVLVGVSYAVAALAARGPVRQRALVALVGVSWLIGSISPQALSWHQAALVVCLIAFPTGRLAGLGNWLFAVLAGAVALRLLPQLGVAALFGSVSIWASTGCVGGKPSCRADRWHRRSRTPLLYPVIAAALVAIAILHSWATADSPHADTDVVFYNMSQFSVAGGFVLFNRGRVRREIRLAEHDIIGSRSGGPNAMQSILRGFMGDADLVLEIANPSDGQYVGVDGDPVEHPLTGGVLPVIDDGITIGRLSTSVPMVADSAAIAGMVEIVRLILVNDRLRRQQSARLAELTAVRSRLLAAADDERERIAARVTMEVIPGLLLAVARIPPADPTDPNLDELLSIVRSQLESSVADLVRLAVGVPPLPLGNGGLTNALVHLTSGWVQGHLTIDCEAAAVACPATETALYYVCCEALTNSAKHAAASNISVELTVEDDSLVLSVTDDGKGGAQPTGSGLLGLADRLSVVGGRLFVGSPVGGGTAIRARAPQHRRVDLDLCAAYHAHTGER